MLKGLVYTLAVIATAGLFFLSLKESVEIPIPDFKNADKLLHTTAYFLLSLLWAQAFGFRFDQWKKTKVYLVTLLYLTFIGIVIENLQNTLTRSRQFEFLDLIANTVGTLTGLAVFATVCHKLLKKH